MKRVAHKEDIFIDLKTKMGNIYWMIFMRDYSVKKSGQKGSCFFYFINLQILFIFFKKSHTVHEL